MEGSTCDLCAQPATVHMTEIRNGQKSERHLCVAHAGQAGIQLPSQEHGTKGMLDNLRGTARFIRRHGRPPSSVEELREGMAPDGDFPIVEIGDAALRQKVEWMEGLIAFGETHGRMPQTAEEWAQFVPGQPLSRHHGILPRERQCRGRRRVSIRPQHEPEPRLRTSHRPPAGAGCWRTSPTQRSPTPCSSSARCTASGSCRGTCWGINRSRRWTTRSTSAGPVGCTRSPRSRSWGSCPPRVPPSPSTPLYAMDRRLRWGRLAVRASVMLALWLGTFVLLRVDPGLVLYWCSTDEMLRWLRLPRRGTTRTFGGSFSGPLSRYESDGRCARRGTIAPRVAR